VASRSISIEERIMFRRIGVASLTVAMMLGFAATGQADSGSIGIAHFRARLDSARSWKSSIIFSNVSGRDVQVTLKLYDQNGNAIGTGGFVPVIVTDGAVVSSNANNTSCTLPSGKSGAFIVGPTTTIGNDWWGHCALEWSSSTDDTQTVALVAQAFLSITPTSSGDQIFMPLVLTRPLPF
jgi:hypothetical protein